MNPPEQRDGLTSGRMVPTAGQRPIAPNGTFEAPSASTAFLRIPQPSPALRLILPSLVELEKNAGGLGKRKAPEDVDVSTAAILESAKRQPGAAEVFAAATDMQRLLSEMHHLTVLYQSLESRVTYCMQGLQYVVAALQDHTATTDVDKSKDIFASARLLVDLQDKKPQIAEKQAPTVAAGSLSGIMEAVRVKSEGGVHESNGDFSNEDDTDEGGEPSDEGFCTPKGALLMGNKKRVKLPEHATVALRSWLDDHQDKPYPSEDDKKLLTQSTGLSIVQINNWFSNARRRYLPKPAAKVSKITPPDPASAVRPAPAAPPTAAKVGKSSAVMVTRPSPPASVPAAAPVNTSGSALPCPPAHPMTVSNMVNPTPPLPCIGHPIESGAGMLVSVKHV